MSEYDFRTLSPSDFERFVCDLLNTHLGLALHNYPEGRDQGIDLLEVRDDNHRTVVQCKHFLKSGGSKLVSGARKEAVKLGRKTADEYIFVTSQEMSNSVEADIIDILDIPQRNVWGQQKLNRVLTLHDEVEQRHPKLWLSSTAALDAIFNAGRWNRSEAHYEAACDRAKFWAETPHFTQVVELLERTGVCIITGPPGVGKTFLSEMVALRYAHDRWNIVYLNDISDAWAVLKKDDSPQLFYYNDFLGEIRLETSARSAAPDIASFMDAVDRRRDQNKRLLVSSRSEVLQEAALAPSTSLRKIAGNIKHRFNVELTHWDEALRRQVVLNHLHFAGMSEDELGATARDRRLTSIVLHPSFNPRLIEAICRELDEEPTASQTLAKLINALNYPEAIWEVSFSALDASAEEVVLTLATLRPRTVAISELRELITDTSRASDWGDALTSLEPTWISISGPSEARTLALANPSCRDYLLGKIGSDRIQADERVERASSLEQLAELARAAGELTAYPSQPPLANRASISNALSHRRDDIAHRVRLHTDLELAKVTTPLARVRTLTTSAALIACYGARDDHIWMTRQVTNLLDESGMEKISAIDGLALAAQLNGFSPTPALTEATNRITLGAIANVHTVRDLDAYATFATELKCAEAPKAIRQKAHRILAAGLDELFDEHDAELIRDTADELKARAAFFGYTIDIEEVLDYALELDMKGGHL
ncbi:restriction endonuclease [Nonomuraea sp. NPDC050540]|uniref:nSTAND3 domain-containing NTPase n=1 Tax=Nonomuraea sp. NPDC050540 TaxID=3364367 RepID=UPI0037A9C290